MPEFIFNEPNVDRLLHGASGPVFSHVEEFVNEVERIAKIEAPNDTGSMANSIKKEPIRATGGGLETQVGPHTLNPRTGRPYSMAVHQGRKEIRPVTKPFLKFYWKRVGSWVQTDYVRPRAGRPFLHKALSVANASLSRGRFKITKTPPRNTGT